MNGRGVSTWYIITDATVEGKHQQAPITLH